MTKHAAVDSLRIDLLLLASLEGGVSRKEVNAALGLRGLKGTYLLVDARDKGLLRVASAARYTRYFAVNPVADRSEARQAWAAVRPPRDPAATRPATQQPQVRSARKRGERGKSDSRPLFGAGQQAVAPAHVTVTVCPGYVGDNRYVVAPAPGWRGQITADWYDRRMAQAQAPVSVQADDGASDTRRAG